MLCWLRDTKSLPRRMALYQPRRPRDPVNCLRIMSQTGIFASSRRENSELVCGINLSTGILLTSGWALPFLFLSPDLFTFFSSWLIPFMYLDPLPLCCTVFHAACWVWQWPLSVLASELTCSGHRVWGQEWLEQRCHCCFAEYVADLRQTLVILGSNCAEILEPPWLVRLFYWGVLLWNETAYHIEVSRRLALYFGGPDIIHLHVFISCSVSVCCCDLHITASCLLFECGKCFLY